MTRDFSKDQRDDKRPYARHTSTGGQNNNQGSSKPARPRLSRDAVDRAWENGATRKYADYRPLQNPQTSSGQRPGRPASSFERSRQPQNRDSYNARSQPFHSSSPSSHQGYQSRGASSSDRGPRNSYGSDRQGSDRQNWQNERRERDTRGSSFEAGRGRGPYQQDRSPRPAQNNHYGSPNRPNYRENAPRSFERPQERFERPDRADQRGHEAPYRPQGTRSFERTERSERPARPFQNGQGAPARPDYRDRAQETRSFDRPERSERPARPFQNGQGAPARSDYRDRAQDTRSFDRSERPARPFQNGYGAPARPDYRAKETRSFDRPERPPHSFQGNRKPAGRPAPGPARRDTYNPRWQSRPSARAEATYGQGTPETEQFEGDYERFDAQKQVGQQQPDNQNAIPHVTRLPDGRVLKGSRPEQRKQARFWNDVTSEAATLMSRPTNAPPVEKAQPSVEEPASKTPAPARPVRKRPEGKTRIVKTVQTSHSGEAGPRSAKVRRPGKKKAAGRPVGPVPRPSQRGFQWPSPPQPQE